ncbi:MAG TPA: glycosyltransferase [Desulfohalobiaceae bacterium]|nr:glycosyltransferase [Desulfohalobiaceae bacterium]
MKPLKRFKLLFYSILILLVLLISYKAYLYIFETDFYSLNIKNINKIQSKLEDSSEISFAVIGNINNSIGIFDKKIVKRLNQSDIDFLISTGNAVSDGSEDKYRVLHKSLEKLEMPDIMAFGDNERTDFGASNFYKHFGPFYFSFAVDNTYFIFLDSTGKTSLLLQKKWLKQELKTSQDFQHRFIVVNSPPFRIKTENYFEQNNYIQDLDFRNFIHQVSSRYQVDAVFSSNLEIYAEKVINSVPYFISGGGGGLLINEEQHSYHYLKVKVSENKVNINKIEIMDEPNPILRKIENLWLFIHSIFYVGALNFLLILCVLALIAIKLYAKISHQQLLFRNFDKDEEEFLSKTLRIAMFTNNYLPFIGGVPISIYRLLAGLKSLGQEIKLFAPAYKELSHNPLEEDVFRCKTILYYSKFNNLPIPNKFSTKIKKTFKEFKPEIVHLHHPFWMGRKGLRLAKKYNLPVIYTYHTRFEKYAHYAIISSTIFRTVVAHYMVKRFADKCDGIIVPTYSTEEYLRNLGVSTLVETIPTGIDTGKYDDLQESKLKETREKYVQEGERLLISVSRLTKEKNIYFLLQGLQQVALISSTPFKCLIIGDGPELQGLKDYARQMGIDKLLYFLGQIEHEAIPVYYAASDIFAFSSTSETQGMVILEAMAGGTPSVAVRSSGIADAIQNNYNGFKTSEDIFEWSKTVSYLIDNNQALERMSKNAKNYAQMFSLEKTAKKVLEFYSRVLATKRKT